MLLYAPDLVGLLAEKIAPRYAASLFTVFGKAGQLLARRDPPVWDLWPGPPLWMFQHAWWRAFVM